MKAPADVRELVQRIAAKHRVSMDDILGRDALKSASRARTEAMVAVRELTKPNGEPRFSTTRIAQMFGRDNHTTVVEAVKRWRSWNNGAGEDA